MLIHIGYGFWIDDAKLLAVLPWKQGSVQTLFRKAAKLKRTIDAVPYTQGTRGRTRQVAVHSIIILDTESGHYYMKTILSPELFARRQRRVYEQSLKWTPNESSRFLGEDVRREDLGGGGVDPTGVPESGAG